MPIPQDALLVKQIMRKARNAAGVVPRQGWVTRRMALLAATRRERPESGATRRDAPWPHADAGGAARPPWHPIERVGAFGNGMNRA